MRVPAASMTSSARNSSLVNLSFGFYSLVLRDFSGPSCAFLLENSVFDYDLRKKSQDWLRKLR